MADYVKETVSGAIIEGLTAVVKAQPEDPVDYLGRFLLHYADQLEAVEKAKKATEDTAKFAEAAQAAASAASAVAQAAAAVAPAAVIAEGEAGLAQILDVAEVDDAVLSAFAEHLSKLLRNAAVYIAERVGEPLPPDAEEGVGATVKYVGCSSAQRDVLSSARITQKDGGVVWRSWVRPEAPAEEAPADGEEGEAKPAPPPPELPVVHVPNVLREQAMVFHGVPRPGSFVAAPLQYGSLLHPNAVPTEPPAPPAEGDEAAAAAAAAAGPPAVPLTRSLAICSDTMGQSRDFLPEEVALLKRAASTLQGALERSEKALYAAEYESTFSKKPEQEAAEADAEKAAAEALYKAAEEASSADIAAAGESAPEDLKALFKAQATLSCARAQFDERAGQLESLGGRRISPKEGALKVLTAAWYLLGWTREQLADAGAPDALALSWPVARRHLGADFASKLREYDAAAVHPPVAGYKRLEALKGLLEGLAPEEVAKAAGAPVVASILAWTKAAIEVREASAAKRKREAEEEAARKAAEEEAAKAAAEAAAAGEGGEE